MGTATILVDMSTNWYLPFKTVYCSSHCTKYPQNLGGFQVNTSYLQKLCCIYVQLIPFLTVSNLHAKYKVK